MGPLNDAELLAEYAENQSEGAFAQLVQRYVALVYSSAQRQVGDAHLAEEITQAVFIILSRKAASLRGQPVLAGWLCRTAHLAAKDALKMERRRRQRETIASQMNAADDTAWQRLSPLLDEAVAQLRDGDRNAIVLRYYEEQSLDEVGATLGIGADAAQKRVSRALEKLRKIFAKRGVALTTVIIAGAVTGNAVQAAPVGLTTTISATAVKGSAVAASTLTLVKGTLKIMTTAKLKLALGIAAMTLLAAGVVEVAVSGPTGGDKESPGAATDEEKGFAKEIMKATADEDFAAFVAHGNAAFKTLNKRAFTSVCDQIKGHLKAGYHIVFLGGLKRDGYHQTMWKVTYDDNKEDDLLELDVKGGKIAGAEIH